MKTKKLLGELARLNEEKEIENITKLKVSFPKKELNNSLKRIKNLLKKKKIDEKKLKEEIFSLEKQINKIFLLEKNLIKKEELAHRKIGETRGEMLKVKSQLAKIEKLKGNLEKISFLVNELSARTHHLEEREEKKIEEEIGPLTPEEKIRFLEKKLASLREAEGINPQDLKLIEERIGQLKEKLGKESRWGQEITRPVQPMPRPEIKHTLIMPPLTPAVPSPPREEIIKKEITLLPPPPPPKKKK